MSILTIADAASKLGVSKKTLMRWDSLGKFPARRDENDARYYDLQDILEHAQWFKLRRKHRAHNRLLSQIRQKTDKFLATQPLGPMENPKFHKFEEMKEAYDELRKWEHDNRKIIEEYSQLPKGFRAKVDPDS